MSSQFIKTSAIVIKKVKLSEYDLIISFLSEDGSLIRAVAKGARKPANTLSARLELCSYVNVLLIKGKNLNIVKEVKLINSYKEIRYSIDKFTSASCAFELLDKTLSYNFDHNKFLPLTISFLDELSKIKNNIHIQYLCMAYIVKLCAFLGYMPMITNCCICNKNLTTLIKTLDNFLFFSYDDGGIVCNSCNNNISTEKYPSRFYLLMHKLKNIKFKDIYKIDENKYILVQCFNFYKKWVEYYFGINIKSINFYIKNYSL